VFRVKNEWRAHRRGKKEGGLPNQRMPERREGFCSMRRTYARSFKVGWIAIRQTGERKG